MKTYNILIIEDDLLSASYLSKLCTKAGFHIINIVSNAKEATDILKTENVDLILMDIMIDGSISGCELAMQIRSYNKEVIIIFLTAYTSEEMITYALDAQAYGYLLKPYRDVEIISTIKMALNQNIKPMIENAYIECKNGFKLNQKTGQLYLYSDEIFLSQKLHNILILLFKNKGSCVSYTQIAESVYDNDENINTIRSSIHRIKTKLPNLDLHSVAKNGYVLY